MALPAVMKSLLGMLALLTEAMDLADQTLVLVMGPAVADQQSPTFQLPDAVIAAIPDEAAPMAGDQAFQRIHEALQDRADTSARLPGPGGPGCPGCPLF